MGRGGGGTRVDCPVGGEQAIPYRRGSGHTIKQARALNISLWGGGGGGGGGGVGLGGGTGGIFKLYLFLKNIF